jgi:hypothetical protein
MSLIFVVDTETTGLDGYLRNEERTFNLNQVMSFDVVSHKPGALEGPETFADLDQGQEEGF